MERKMSVLIILGLFMISTIAILPELENEVLAENWTQTNDWDDFETGTLENLEIVGTDDSARMKLRKQNELGIWHEQQQSPPGVYCPAMAYDSMNNKIVLFGGYDGSVLYDDTWIYDVQSNTWTNMNPSTNPSARYKHSMVYDSTNNKVILFGGYVSGIGQSGDTWVYDVSANTWTEVCTGGVAGSDKPEARFVYAMAFDSANSKIILFGGYDGSNYLDDTWTYDYSENTWTKIRDGGTTYDPDARDSHVMTYDSYERKIVLFGGKDGSNYFDDTWTYDYSENMWTKRKPYEKPEGRRLSTLTYDSFNKKCVLFGGCDSTTYFGDTWVYDTKINEWTEVRDGSASDEPSDREGQAMAYDSANNNVVLFGGYYYNSQSYYYSDTWIYEIELDIWTNTAPCSEEPDSRKDFSMVYDSKNEIVILFGGNERNGNQPPIVMSDTWTYDCSNNLWKNMNPTSSPSARCGHAMTYDSVNEKAILFGGYDGSNELGETWIYDYNSNQWTQKTTNPEPSARKGSKMVYDSSNNKVVLFGGTDGTNYLNDVWLYDVDDNIWEQKTQTTKPGVRYYHEMTFDTTYEKIIMFGGNYGGSNYYSDTWTYDVFTNTWEDKDPSIHPTQRHGHVMTYDPINKKVILFGGWDHATQTLHRDTWYYDLSTNTWRETNPMIKPTARRLSAMAYDSVNEINFMAFGEDNNFIKKEDIYNFYINNYNDFGYYESGTYAFNVDKFNYITFRTNTNPDGFIRFQVAVNDDGIDWNFVGPDGTSLTFYDDITGGNLYDGYNGQYMRYRAYFTTSYGGNTPVLFEVSFSYNEENDPTVVLTSPNGGEDWMRDKFYPITWEAEGDLIQRGKDGSNYKNDIWEFGTDWVKKIPRDNTIPPAREKFGMAYDSSNNVIVLFGGTSGTLYGDTWIYDVSSDQWEHRTPSYWNDQTPSTEVNPISPRFGHCLAYDSSNSQIVLFGGQDVNGYKDDTWVYDYTNDKWILKSPSTKPTERIGHAMVDDTSSIILFGGYDGDTYKLDTWSWDGSDWSSRAPASSGRAWHAMAYDSSDIILFGGYDGNYKSDTLKWTGTGWTTLTPSDNPLKRAYHAMDFDSYNNKIILYGGYDGYNYFEDTWEWTGSNWNEKNPSKNPGGLKNHALIYEDVNNEIVLFGGNDGSQDEVEPGPISLYYSVNNGETWTTIVEGLADVGSYSWLIPNIDTPSAMIKVTATDINGNTVSDTSDSSFAIDPPPASTGKPSDSIFKIDEVDRKSDGNDGNKFLKSKLGLISIGLGILIILIIPFFILKLRNKNKVKRIRNRKRVVNHSGKLRTQVNLKS